MSDRIPDGYGELHLEWGLPSDPEPMFSALGFQYSGTLDDGLSVANQMRDAWNARLGVYPPEDYTLGPGFVTFGADPDDVSFGLSGAPVAAGGGAGYIPNNSCLLVRKLTALGGKRGRGRMYVPGVNVAWVDYVGTILPGVVTNIQDDLENFTVDCLAITEFTAFMLFHETAPFAPTLINLLQLQPKIATQRRRMRP